MNFSHLTYFKKLAEVKHFTKALQSFTFLQPTLSAAISSLEKELNTRLFYRANNKIELTPCGEEFYDYVLGDSESSSKEFKLSKNMKGR